MQFERYIFEVAIYKISEAEFWSEYEADLAESLADLERRSGIPLDRAPHAARSFKLRFWDEYVAPWRYNQIVGWIHVFVLGKQVRGDLWLVDAKRYRKRMILKKFRLRGKAFEVVTSRDEDNAVLAERVRESLLRVAHRFGRRKLAVDIEAFNNLSPYVDWRRLLGYEVDPVS